MKFVGHMLQRGTPAPDNPVPIEEYLFLKDTDWTTGKERIVAVYKKVTDKEELQELLEEK